MEGGGWVEWGGWVERGGCVIWASYSSHNPEFKFY